VPTLLLRGIFEERSNTGQLARGRRGSQTFPAPPRKKRAQVHGAELQQVCGVNRTAAMLPQEIDKAMRRRHVGADRVWRSTAIVLQIFGPPGGELARRVMI
jgi:hypothetical protein